MNSKARTYRSTEALIRASVSFRDLGGFSHDDNLHAGLCVSLDPIGMGSNAVHRVASMITLEMMKALVHERIVMDLGQFTPDAAKWLRKEVKAGRVQTMMIYQRFPVPKRGYWVADT